MKIISARSLKFLPASHEKSEDPAVFKKILATSKDFLEGGKLQMINWARILKGKSFQPHFHQDMEEIFIILSGKVKIIIDNQEAMLKKGDMVLIPKQSVHKMENIGNTDADYLVIGISLQKRGKTITLG